MEVLLIGLSSVLTIVAAIPYMIAIVRGQTKPRIVSWFTWALLTGIACAASFADRQIASGILMLCATFEVLMVVILGLKHGDRKFERLDIMCQVAALVGLLLWWVFDSPTVAVLAAVAIDAIGAIPTFKHSWQRPHEETWITYALSGLGAVCTLLVVTSWQVTAIAYPLYIVVVNIALAVLILLSPHRKVGAKPSNIRSLQRATSPLKRSLRL